MGWTSKDYTGDKTHLTFDRKDAIDFMEKEYYNYGLAAIHLHQAKDEYDHNEIYAIMKSTRTRKNFICVIILNIKNDEIYWKAIEESMGPAYTNCPDKFFNFVDVPDRNAKEWRIQCMKKSIKFEPLN